MENLNEEIILLCLIFFHLQKSCLSKTSDHNPEKDSEERKVLILSSNLSDHFLPHESMHFLFGRKNSFLTRGAGIMN